MSEKVIRPIVDLLLPETCPKALAKFYNDAQRKAISEGVSKGSIGRVQKFVKIRKGKSGTGQAELWPFWFYYAIDAPGMAILSRGLTRKSVKMSKADIDKLPDAKQAKAKQDKVDGACDYFNYGWILALNQPIRIMLENSLGGVDKAIAKQVAQVMKTGLFTEEQAMKWIVEQREKLGLEIPDDVNDDESDDDENVA